MKIFKIMIADSATYYVKDETGNMDPDLAVDIAMEWFMEREPEIVREELEASSFPAVDAYCG
jgi:hypothetical protein